MTDTAAKKTGVLHYAISALVGAGVAALAFFLFTQMKKDQEQMASGQQAPAQETASQAAKVDFSNLSGEQKEAVENIVKEYLLGNPQILMQMSEALEAHQVEQRNERLQTAIKSNADAIFRDGFGLEAGNPKGDVTIVEFSDYNCPYCKRAFNSLTKILEEDKNVRVVLKEFPIFGERSEGAARVAIAAGEQGKYFELHSALLRSRGRSNTESALKLGESLGLDVEKLRKDMSSEKVTNIIRKTREIGNELGIQGTPFYLVGDKVIPGAPDDLHQVFQQNIAEIRKDGCKHGC